MNIGFILKILLVGQFQCVTFTGCGIFTYLFTIKQSLNLSQFLKKVKLETPLFNSLFLYIFMLGLFLFKFARTNTANKWGYLLASIFDFIGLVTLILAFQLTKLASVTLVSVFGVVSAAIASICILNLQYLWIHYLSIVICICGVIVTIYSDLFNSKGQLDLGNLLGDLMGIIASSAYGLSSTISQKLLGKKGNIWSLLAYFGLFGLILGIAGFFAHQQYQTISDFQEDKSHNDLNFLLYFGYGLIAFVNYTITIYFIKIAGAATVNLNALTNTLWTMAADYFIFKRAFKWIAVVGYIVIIIGVILFHIRDPIAPKTQNQKQLHAQQCSEQEQIHEDSNSRNEIKPFLSLKIQSEDPQNGSKIFKSDIQSNFQKQSEE